MFRRRKYSTLRIMRTTAELFVTGKSGHNSNLSSQPTPRGSSRCLRSDLVQHIWLPTHSPSSEQREPAQLFEVCEEGYVVYGPPTRPQIEPARCTERSCIPRAGARGNILPRIQKSKRLVTKVGKLSKHHLEAGPPHCSWLCLPGTEAAAPRSLSSSALDAAGIRDAAARALAPEAFRATGCLFGGSRGSRFCSSPALLDHMSPLTNDSPKHAPTFLRAPKGSPRDLGLRPGRGVSPGRPRSLPKAGLRTASRRRPPRRPSAAARRGAGLRGSQWEGCPDPASPRCGRGYTSRAVALTPGRRRPTPPAAPPRGPQPLVAWRLRPPAAPRRRPRRQLPRRRPARPRSGHHKQLRSHPLCERVFRRLCTPRRGLRPRGAAPRPPSPGKPARPKTRSRSDGARPGSPDPGATASHPTVGGASRQPEGPRGPPAPPVGGIASLSFCHSFVPQLSGVSTIGPALSRVLSIEQLSKWSLFSWFFIREELNR